MAEEPLVPDEVVPPAGKQTPAPDQGWLREGLLAFPNIVKLLGRLMRDPRVPLRTRAFVVVVLGYLFSPIDLMPDFVPVLGQADDLLLAVLALHYLLTSVGDEVLLEHWDGSEDLLALMRGVVDWGSEAVPWPLRRAVARYVNRR